MLSGQGKAILISSHILTELAEICTGAVIIERGQILRAGSLSQILTADVPHRTILIRPLDEPEILHKHLLLLPNIEAVRLIDHSVEVDLTGGEEGCWELLANLVRERPSHRRVPPAARRTGATVYECDARRSAMKSARFMVRLDDLLNPIVVKELRQAVKSRVVMSALLLFLILSSASCLLILCRADRDDAPRH